MKIAPLLFLPFVENAFKHASRDDRQLNRIRIGLRQDAAGIRFDCNNTYTASDRESAGIGLTNVIRRLELLYKDRYTLETDREGHVYSVRLTLRP